jgi:hypothetical protein
MAPAVKTTQHFQCAQLAQESVERKRVRGMHAACTGPCSVHETTTACQSAGTPHALCQTVGTVLRAMQSMHAGYWHRCSTPALPMPTCHEHAHPAATAQTARPPAGGATVVAHAQHQRQVAKHAARRAAAAARPSYAVTVTHTTGIREAASKIFLGELRKESIPAGRSSSRARTTTGRGPAVKRWQLLLRQLAAPLITHSPLPVTQASPATAPTTPTHKTAPPGPQAPERLHAPSMHCACPPGTQAAVAPNTCTPHTCHTCWALAQGPDSNPTPSMPRHQD